MANAPGSRDYRDLKREGDPEKDKPNINTDRRWWEKKGPGCAQRIISTLGHLEKAQAGRTKAAIGYARLYASSEAFGGISQIAASILANRSLTAEKATYSAIQVIVDVLTSRVGEVKPRPYFLTSGGNYRQQRKAKKLNQLVEGIFYETKTYDLGIDCFKDAAISGDGFMHVWADHSQGKVRHERVAGNELWVDEVEAQYGFPRNMWRAKVVDRDELVGAFPEKKKEIMECDRAHSNRYTTTDDTSDMVKVVEAWRLGTKKKNGKCEGGFHAICLVDSDVMLVEPEKYEYDFFPFARLPWAKRPFGFWAQGVCERRAAEQRELNKLLSFGQTAMQRASKLWVFLPNASKVATEQINNDIGTVIRGNEKPEWYTPQPIHPMYLEEVDRRIARMEREEGLSQTAIAGKKEPGINSGAAIRALEEQASDRFKALQRANDNFYLEIAHLDVAMALELGNVKVRVPGKKDFTEIDLKRDIEDVSADEFVMQVYPVSRLPNDPAGRLQTIQEFIQAGWINPRHGKRLMDFPDLDAEENLSTAQEDLVCCILDKIVDEGEYTPPEPTDDLDLCKEMVLWYISRYRMMDLEEERLDMLRDFNAQVDMYKEREAQQMMAAQAAAQPQVPQAVASKPPQSDLMQQAA